MQKRKPLMERKRRQRINDSLETLKSILLESKSLVPESSKTAKLEKADILELTVQYVQQLKTQIFDINRLNVNKVRPIKSKDVKVRKADSSCDTPIKYQLALVQTNMDNSKSLTFVIPTTGLHGKTQQQNHSLQSNTVWRPW